ncbi:hypothetical protein Tsubulata_005974 [Turnera subulata]|uniref:Tropinone reductase-like 3 n=1 Tax=Turnera subulata TaxID=218843 RepID=A0A9Q0JG23_9ROSI|nr:hypothetical protein Tsubulata_005974 [Turnera subulata]
MDQKVGKRFEGKVAIVTASSEGIGFAIAERFGLEGASLVVSSRKQKNVQMAVEKLKAKGISQVLGVVCHVANPEHRKNLIRQTLEKFGKIDAVVSNAGTNLSDEPILKIPESIVDKLWEINVKSAILILQEAAPHLNKGSPVVLVSSVSGYDPVPPIAMYGVTKTTLLGLTKALAKEMAPHTRVNCVAPGIIPTRLAHALIDNGSKRESAEEGTLLKRLGTAAEVAAAAAFLASDDANYTTGEVLLLSGGAHARM